MRKLASGWIAFTIAAWLVATHDGGALARWAALDPIRVWHGEVWRLVTWPFVGVHVGGVIARCLVVHRFAGKLESAWGARELARFALWIAIAAGATTCAIAVLSRTAQVPQLGGMAMDAALIVAFAQQFPDGYLIVGAFRIPGAGLGAIGVVLAWILILALVEGPLAMVPELAAFAAAFYAPARTA